MRSSLFLGKIVIFSKFSRFFIQFRGFLYFLFRSFFRFRRVYTFGSLLRFINFGRMSGNCERFLRWVLIIESSWVGKEIWVMFQGRGYVFEVGRIQLEREYGAVRLGRCLEVLSVSLRCLYLVDRKETWYMFVSIWGFQLGDLNVGGLFVWWF